MSQLSPSHAWPWSSSHTKVLVITCAIGLCGVIGLWQRYNAKRQTNLQYHIFHHIDAALDYRLTKDSNVYQSIAKLFGFYTFDPTNERNSFHAILPGLYLSNRYAAWNREALKSHGITHILVAGSGLSMHYPTEFTYQKHSFSDEDTSEAGMKLEAILPEAVNFIHQALQMRHLSGSHSTDKVNVLVHCSAGISRSTSLIVAYLISHHHMTVEEAIDHIRLQRPFIQPNPSFLKVLKKHEEQVKMEKQTASRHE